MTRGLIFRQAFIMLVSLLLISCAGNKNKPLSSVKACYQNSFGDDKFMDFEVLIIMMIDSTVEGQFHWLPAFKDRRMGYFKGTRTNQVIFAKYDYMQEGKKSSAEIQLILNDQSISVSGGEPTLGLTSEIQQINCENLTEVPLAK